MNKELTTIAVLLFLIIFGIKALEDPSFQPDIQQTIEVEVQNLMQQMVGDSFKFDGPNVDELIPDTMYGIKIKP